jgi:alpha-ribazole phosphatase
MNTPAPPASGLLWLWRHPVALGASGRCIGHTDLPVDPRKAKRLAHRIRRMARQHALPRRVHVSPLCRARAVGRWLARWGWHCQVDARLAECNFGSWEGRTWAEIAWHEVAAWEADLLRHRPGQGECLHGVMLRARSWAESASRDGQAVLAVTHGGVISALGLRVSDASSVDASTWPAACRHGSLTRLSVQR